MIVPLAIHEYSGDKVYISTRDLASPGSGTWSDPVKIFDSGDPGIIFKTCSAGALTGTLANRRGIIGNITGMGLFFIGNGLPDTPQQVDYAGSSTGQIEGLAGDGFWGTSLGAWYYNNLYWMLVNSTATFTFAVISSPSGLEGTWTEVDGAHAPPLFNAGLPFQAVNYDPVNHPGTLTFIVYNVFNGYDLFSFDMNGGGWSFVSTLVTADKLVFGEQGHSGSNGIYKFPNGDVGIIFNVLSGNEVFYQLYDSGAANWGSRISVVSGSPTVLGCANTLLDPSGELIHVWTYQDGGAASPQPVYSQVTHAGVVTAKIFTFPAYGSTDGVNHGMIFQGGGLNAIFIGYQLTTAGSPNQVWVSDLPGGTFFSENLPIPSEIGPDEEPSCAFMIFGGTVPTVPTLACPTNNQMTVGVPYSGQLQESGGTAPFTYAIIGGSLPTGVTLDTSTGVISGIPTVSADYVYTAEVTDADGLTAETTCMYQVLPPGQAGSPCDQASIGPPVPATDVQWELTRVNVWMKPAPRIPTRGS